MWIGRSMYSRPQFTDYLYGRYQTLLTEDDNFWKCSLELIYKPKYQIWCESDVPCAQETSLPILLIWEVPDPEDRCTSDPSLPIWLIWEVPDVVIPLRLFFVVLLRVSIQANISNLVWIGRSMCSRPQFTDFTYMGGTRPWGPMTIIFGSIFKS